MNKERKQPTTLFAVVSFLAIIAVLIIMINLGCNTTLSVFAGVIVAVITTKNIICLYFFNTCIHFEYINSLFVHQEAIFSYILLRCILPLFYFDTLPYRLCSIIHQRSILLFHHKCKRLNSL